jgi:hypothetical protein
MSSRSSLHSNFPNSVKQTDKEEEAKKEQEGRKEGRI